MADGLGALIGGVFIGAVAAEIIRRKRPELLDMLYAKSREAASEVKEAFKRGYEGAEHPAAGD